MFIDLLLQEDLKLLEKNPRVCYQFRKTKKDFYSSPKTIQNSSFYFNFAPKLGIHYVEKVH